MAITIYKLLESARTEAKFTEKELLSLIGVSDANAILDEILKTLDLCNLTWVQKFTGDQANVSQSRYIDNTLQQ